MSSSPTPSHSSSPSNHSLNSPPPQKPINDSLSSPSNSSESNLWFLAFLTAFLAILFSHPISNYLNSNDEQFILLQQSALLQPNLSAWNVRHLTHRGGGYGLLASRPIAPGELLIKEKPILRFEPKNVNDQKLANLIKDLNGEDRVRFLSLSNAWLNRTDRYRGIVQTNAIQAGAHHLAIFPAISRLNHACAGASNAVYHWREREGVEVVHATRAIQPGQEILVSYYDSKSPRHNRQEFLKAAYGFECSCSVCEMGEVQSHESDARLEQINHLKSGLGAWPARSIGGREAVELIEEAIHLMQLEGITSEYGQMYADAAHVASAHSDFQSVRHYAKLAQTHFTIELGSDSIEVLVAKKLVRNPTSSTVWATRPPEQVRSQSI